MLRYWLRYVPLMRSLLAFLAGVFSTEYFVVVPQISILMGLLLLTVILFYFRYPSFRFAWIPGSLIIVVFFLFGEGDTQREEFDRFAGGHVGHFFLCVFFQIAVASRHHGAAFFA